MSFSTLGIPTSTASSSSSLYLSTLKVNCTPDIQELEIFDDIFESKICLQCLSIIGYRGMNPFPRTSRIFSQVTKSQIEHHELDESSRKPNFKAIISSLFHLSTFSFSNLSNPLDSNFIHLLSLGNIKVLNLSRFQLLQPLPDIFLSFSQLESIFLNNVDIVPLPETAHLQSLFPSSIFSHPSLVSIQISINISFNPQNPNTNPSQRLTIFPKNTLDLISFGKLSSFQLNMEGLESHISFDEKLHTSPFLKEFTYNRANFSLNPSSEFTFLNFPNLYHLNLHNNNFSQFPLSITSLKNLTVLNFNYNKLESIPSEISLLHRLEALYLFDNKLVELVDSLFTLKNLRHLNISENSIKKIHPYISQLQKLEKFHCSSNKLTTFPFQQIVQIPSIVEISLQRNPFTMDAINIGRPIIHQLRKGGTKFLI